MKIAIPVDCDKKTIFKRTGHAPYFAIYEDDKLIDFVSNGHTHGEHIHEKHSHADDEDHTNGHQKDIAGLQGCDMILVRMIGEHMREALKNLNIEIKKIREKDGLVADEAIANFLQQKL